MSPRISVLMSVYNGQPFLADAVDSILNQNSTEFEFIIFDDKSTDGSLESLRRYAADDKRIRLIENEERQGLGKNLQEGMKLAKAPLVARMDSDDISAPNRFSKQVEFLDKNKDIDILGSWAEDIDERGKSLGIRKCPTQNDKIQKYIWTCPIIHPSVMFRKDAVIKAGSYGAEQRRQDYALWFRCAKAGLQFANLDETLIKYRFSDSYFTKNNFSALLTQVSIGIKGCWLIKASPIAYFGVCVPLIKGIMPSFCKRGVSRIIKRFDPRNA